MTKVFNVSEILHEEEMPENTDAFWTGSGDTVFFWRFTTGDLWVKHRGRSTYADLPSGDVENIEAREGALYFATRRQIYKAVYDVEYDLIRVSDWRPKIKGEQGEYYENFYSRMQNGEKFVYRMSDDPEKNGILMDKTDENREFAVLSDIFEGKAVFINYKKNLILPTVRKLSENVLMIETEYKSRRTCFRGGSLLYFTYGNSDIIVLNTDTMEFVATLRFKDIQLARIVTVCNGMIIVTGNTDTYRYKCVMKAHLPSTFVSIIKEQNDINKSSRTTPIIANTSSTAIEIKTSTIDHEKVADLRMQEVTTENERMRLEIEELEKQLIESKVGALQVPRKTLKYNDFEKLSKPLVCIQLGNGIMLYFDNAKPFELFIMKDGNPVNGNLKLLEGEFDCSFRGTMGSYAYFNTVRGKVIKFFSAHVEEGSIVLEQLNEMKTSEISLFKNQSYYYVERSKEWAVYKYEENYSEMVGEKFDISGVDLLSKYERHYHRGVLYLFRETSIAKIERVNEKVVKVEGPLLDEKVTNFYTTPHSDFIYVLNSDENVLLVLNTTDLTVTQQCYEPPADSNNHSIVGIHDGIITMAFDGVWGRNLSTAKMT